MYLVMHMIYLKKSQMIGLIIHVRSNSHKVSFASEQPNDLILVLDLKINISNSYFRVVPLKRTLTSNTKISPVAQFNPLIMMVKSFFPI